MSHQNMPVSAIRKTPMRGLLLTLLFAVTITALAETNYVDDNLTITLRTGQGTAFQVLRSLSSGTAMEVLERNDKYARVRLKDGTEGWVLSQYLVTTPAARDLLAQMEQRLERFTTENQQLKKDLANLRNEKHSVEDEQKQASTTVEKLQAELEQLKTVAARPLELEKQNREISKRLQELELDTLLLQEENTALRDRTNRDWFLAGAAVILIGLALGLILPKLRRRQSWSDWR